MEREPRDFDRPGLENDVAGMDDAAFDARIEALGPAPGILHVDYDDPEGDARAIAQIERGEGIPNAIVGEWLKTWGKPGRVSFWEWYRARNG